MSKVLSFNNISKNFKVSIKGKGFIGFFKRKNKIIEALKNVSFEIEQGDIVGYIGPNGAGKSTTIKIMSGILTPTSGECSIMGYVPWKDRKKYVQNIGVVFGQRSQLWWDVPVKDSFELLKEIYKIPKDEYDETVKILTEKLNLTELLDRPLRQLSLGQKMKCELAGSLLHKPKILFLDEPTIGLDAITKLAVRDFIKEINKLWGTTVLLTTHDMSDIEALTNKIILIGRGEILYQGSFDAIKNKYDNVKSIKLTFKDEVKDFNIENYDVISHEKNVVVIRNKEDNAFNISTLLEQTKQYDLVDFSVSNLTVDEILARLYKDYKL